ncbi:MAG: hypothetical protein WDO71_01145 [Bacteroidota bacterium]
MGATLVGIDKSNRQNLDYVGMLKNYFNKETGWDIMMNNTCPEVAPFRWRVWTRLVV